MALTEYEKKILEQMEALCARKIRRWPRRCLPLSPKNPNLRDLQALALLAVLRSA